MWLIITVVIVAAVLMIVAGRHGTGETGAGVTSIDDAGLRTADRTVGWASVFEVIVITRRRLGGTWYGFEVRTSEAGLLVIDGADELGRDFLAQSYRLRGFDHQAVDVALRSRTPRTTCYTS